MTIETVDEMTAWLMDRMDMRRFEYALSETGEIRVLTRGGKLFIIRVEVAR